MKITNYKVKLEYPIEISKCKCPLCGETKSFRDLYVRGICGTKYIWFRKFINIYRYTQEKYTCYTCGAEWKSKITKEKVIIQEI